MHIIALRDWLINIGKILQTLILQFFRNIYEFFAYKVRDVALKILYYLIHDCYCFIYGDCLVF